MAAGFDFDTHAARRITHVGVTFRTRGAEEVAEIVRKARADLRATLEAGELSLPLDRPYRLEQVNEALARMKANEHFGKLALVP
jgi:NADPH2:quinone reductase